MGHGGGGYEFGWGRQEDADSLATIHRALDLGINWIDTAAVYGLGHAEEIIGKALQAVSKRPLVFTKCTLVWDDRGRISHSIKEASIRQEVAVAWALGHPAVTGAIVGGRRPDQHEEIIKFEGDHRSPGAIGAWIRLRAMPIRSAGMVGA